MSRKTRGMVYNAYADARGVGQPFVVFHPHRVDTRAAREELRSKVHEVLKKVDLSPSFTVIFAPPMNGGICVGVNRQGGLKFFS